MVMVGIMITRSSLILVIRGFYAAGITVMVLLQACSTSTTFMAMMSVTTQPAPLWSGSSHNINIITVKNKLNKLCKIVI